MAYYEDESNLFGEYPLSEPPRANKKRNATAAFNSCIIKREESGADQLTDVRDADTCYNIINYIYGSISSVESHQIAVKETYYIIKFSPAYEITSFLRGIVSEHANIRDIKIQPINAIQDEVNKASFTIVVEVLSHRTKDLMTNSNGKRSITDYVEDNIVPTFTPADVIEYHIEKELFAKTILGDNKANSLPNALVLPYNIINDIAYAIVNINSTAPDMGVTLLYEELPNKQNRKIYGIKFVDFPEISYSLIEYIDTVKSSNNFLYNVKLISDNNKQQNILIFQLLEREQNSTELLETVNGEQYYMSFPKRNRHNVDSTTPVIVKKTKTTGTTLQDDSNNNNNNRRSIFSLFSRKK